MTVVVGVAIPCVVQKLKVGYNKGADVSNYHTYTWAQPHCTPTRPVLNDYVVNVTDGELGPKASSELNTMAISR